MKMTGEERIAAPREAVYAALNDPEILKQAIPGCKELNKLSETEMEAKVGLAVGPVRATFTGSVTLTDLDPPNGYRIVGEGKGGAAGFAKGGASVRLEDDGTGGTILHYDVDADVGGKLAQLGSRLIDSTAKKLAKQFFETFGTLVGGAQGEAGAAQGEPELAETGAPELVATVPPEAGKAKPLLGGRTGLMIAGAAVLVAILLVLMGK